MVCLAWDLVDVESPTWDETFSQFDHFEWFGAGLFYRGGMIDFCRSRYAFFDHEHLSDCCMWCDCRTDDPPLTAVSVALEDGRNGNDIQFLFDVRGTVDPGSPGCPWDLGVSGRPKKTYLVDSPPPLLSPGFWTLSASATILEKWWE